MAVVVAVFAGYLVLMVMLPTKAYKQTWLPELRAHTTTTYFGTNQGATFLVFTSPLLLIALLGCVYIHLGRKSRNNNISTKSGEVDQRVEIWKRPVIVKGLGIVSRIELAFFTMFIALLLWNMATYLHNDFAKITPKSAAKTGEKVWEAKLEMAALRLGLVGNIVLSLLFFPVTRGSSVLPLMGITSEGSIKYHIWLGHIVMALFTAHGFSYIIYWAATRQLSQMVKWENTGVANVAGELSLLSGLVLWATTFPKIRRKMFELFFYTHHLYILFVFFFALHVGISYTSIMLPGFFLFIIDRYLRFLQSRRHVRLMSARVLPCQAVELNFSKAKGLSYTPTSIMFMNVPSISKLQWHPFTISSSSNLESDKISVVIKGEGKWSNKLNELLASPSSLERLDVSIEGPYGPASTDFLRHDLLVMVSGGSGITPFISITRELIHAGETLKCKTPKILLITAFKNSADLTMLDLIFPISGAPPQLSNTSLQVEAFVTREKPTTATPQDLEKKATRTIWFKPSPLDAPLTPILGQNNWLWLGAIIVSSFIIYLIFIGILTRYYIYPIDHNTNKIYSSAKRVVLHILFICIGIVIAATAAFLWNKNRNAKETTQIQNMEGATPMSSPNSWYYNADREMESLPQESLMQSVNVHYGERPDLKKYLFERKESSVGVLVCGPKKLRHDVAKICSSGLAANLHFESISFSW
ncbi:ferric reduction oxidase 2 [Perilla frutescens var. hirtella]|uniref:ferric-chelate reductase (NADH) n=1 Tax=Perilla frutescens var. hirtella TaxID=608512 RepID=A0AAD4NX62_PERFH|nr:ferric reduction oxidase 2 [Perilla frutescens var. hirtella]